MVGHFVRDEGAAGSNPVIPTRKKHFVRSAFFNEAFLFGNIKSLTLMKLPLAMKCAYGTLRKALLHKFAKRIYFIVTKSLLHICRANASLK